MRVITEDEVKNSSINQYQVCQKIIEETFIEKKNKSAASAQEIAMVPDSIATGAFYSLPAYLKKLDIAGIKWTNHIPANRKGADELPYTTPTLLLNQLTTGQRLAVVEGLAISGLRTGGVSATALKYLDKLRATSLLCCGAGFQAYNQLAMILPFMQELKDVYLWNRTEHKGLAFKAHLEQQFGSTVRFHFLRELPAKLDFAEIVIGVTATADPYLSSEQFCSNQLYLHIGMNDINPASLNGFDRIFCDDYEAGKLQSSQSLFQASRSSLIDEGKIILLENLMGETGINLAHKKQKWMFNAYGLAIFDLALAHHVLQEGY